MGAEPSDESPDALRPLLLASLFLPTACACPVLRAGEGWDPAAHVVRVPRLEKAPRIDGDLSEWKSVAFSDGLWDLARLRQAPWFDPAINRLTDHGGEPATRGGPAGPLFPRLG